MHLEYRDNIDYGRQSNAPGIDDLAAELAAAIGRDEEVREVYEAVRQAVLADLKYSDLAITRVVPDVLRISAKSETKALILLHLLADPFASYRELGERTGVSKARVGFVLSELSGKIGWLKDFLQIHNGRR